jgi:uncharacterized protein YeaO (DUF488 family)
MATTKDTAPAEHLSTHQTPEERRLRVLEDRYRNELMSGEELCELRDHILKLRRKLETLAETVDTHHSRLQSITTFSDL